MQPQTTKEEQLQFGPHLLSTIIANTMLLEDIGEMDPKLLDDIGRMTDPWWDLREYLAGNVGNMSATCRPDTAMSANFSRNGMSRRHNLSFKHITSGSRTSAKMVLLKCKEVYGENVLVLSNTARNICKRLAKVNALSSDAATDILEGLVKALHQKFSNTFAHFCTLANQSLLSVSSLKHKTVLEKINMYLTEAKDLYVVYTVNNTWK